MGTFAACNVLEVEIKRTAHATTPSAASTTRKNWMEQRICVKGIGKAFLLEAVPRLQVFWDTPVQGVLSIGAMKTAAGGDYLADAKTHPFIRNGRSDGQRRPEPGVYVHGIFVRSPKIENTIMSFFGKRLDVIGRDRNDVDDDELVEATATVLRRCGDLATLRDLLQPLRGKKQVALSSSSPSWSTSSTSRTGRDAVASARGGSPCSRSPCPSASSASHSCASSEVLRSGAVGALIPSTGA